MKKLNLLFGFLIAICMSNALPAQIHAGLWTGYVDGIAIRSMAQRDSFLYIYTWSGTAFVNTSTGQSRFFHDMGNPDLPVFVDLRISTVDKQGNLWAFTNNQLAKISPDGNIQYVGGMPDYQVITLDIDHNGQLWAGLVTEPVNNPATTKCMAKFTNGSWQSIDFGQTRMNIQDIAFDNQNQPVVIARSVYNPSGVFQYNGTSFVKIPNSTALWKLSLSSDGQIAISGNTTGSALKVYKNGSWTTYGLSNPNVPDNFCHPYFDANNDLFVCHNTGSVYTLENGQLEEHLSPPNNYRTESTPDLVIPGFALDNQGKMWLGYSDGLFEASVEDPQIWNFVPTSDLLTPKSPRSIAVFHDTVWFANDGGVTRLVNDSFEKLSYPALKRPALFYDSLRQGLWVGSDGPRLDFYQGQQHTQITIPFPTSLPYFGRITRDSMGNLWTSTGKDLLRFSPNGDWYSFNIGDEFPAYFYIGSVYAKGSRMYVSVYGAYPWLPNENHVFFYSIDGDIVTKLDLPEDELLNTNSFAIRSEQDIWFDDSDKMIHFVNGQIETYTTSELGGKLSQARIILYNDTIPLVSSIYGLYIFKKGKWYHPAIPSNILTNYGIGSCILLDNKLYMAQNPLLVLEDVKALVDQLETLYPVNPDANSTTLVYPNPTSGLLNMDKIIAEFGPDLSAFLYNEYGQQVGVFSAPLPNTLDLGQYPSGIYFLSIKSGNKLVLKNQTIIKYNKP
jgi:hypothetical protein